MDATIDWKGPDGRRLTELRQRFLEGGALDDYWKDEHLVDLYDRTFGARISWKWIEVLDRVADRLPAPPPALSLIHI